MHRLTALDSTVERYNKLAHRLKLIPATSKRADGTNYELRINRDSANQVGAGGSSLTAHPHPMQDAPRSTTLLS